MNHILYISNEAMMGGAAQSLLNMLKVIRNRNIYPVVILPNHGIIEDVLKEMNIKYYVIPFTTGYGKIGTGSKEKDNADFVANYEAALKLQEIIQYERIDLIHINTSVSNIGAFAALMAGIPYVWHFRELVEEDFECEFWDKTLKNELMKYADATIAISKTVLTVYKDKYEVTPVHIYNGIDADKYRRELSRLSHDESMHNFIITGAISKNKGQFDAVRALEILLSEGIKNIHLTMMGHGSEGFRWFLKKYIQQHELEQYVTVLPFQKDLTEYRKNCEYALTTSKMEALGRCTIEAMFAGNIVIGADTGGTKEIIGEDETRGYLYRQGDVKSLASVMKRVMEENPQIKEQCRRNAQRYVEETFSLDGYADKMISLYEGVLTRESSGTNQNKKIFIERLAKRHEHLRNLTTSYKLPESNYQVTLKKWMYLNEQNRTISGYLKNKNIKTVAIYGMGNLGSRLYDELLAADVTVPYVIDRKSELLKEVMVVKDPESKPEGVDAVIVTVLSEEESMASHYREKYACCAMGISEILDNLIK